MSQKIGIVQETFGAIYHIWILNNGMPSSSLIIYLKIMSRSKSEH